MSRSRKKSRWIKAKRSGPVKRAANKKVRRTEDIPSGKAFRKASETWDIFDERFYLTPARAIDAGWKDGSSYPDKFFRK